MGKLEEDRRFYYQEPISIFLSNSYKKFNSELTHEAFLLYPWKSNVLEGKKRECGEIRDEFKIRKIRIIGLCHEININFLIFLKIFSESSVSSKGKFLSWIIAIVFPITIE